ncbi:unnamed protein product [Nippostrongylus brasiliensis]|uniref:Methyltransferase n=1 Tax=Nippostrongylus brasiliensis TaxID=27835 RepID=A0A0N4YLA5_NIPBR|nr:unnamed protein product [Nippostrongylus brasiliensis]
MTSPVKTYIAEHDVDFLAVCNLGISKRFCTIYCSPRSEESLSLKGMDSAESSLDPYLSAVGNWATEAKNVREMMNNYFSRRDNMTDPPTAIQKYVVRESGKAGRDKTLKALPTNVEAVLIDFALNMLGYGWPEIRNPAGVELENSRCFFTSLGKTFEERNAELRILIEQREDWKMLINEVLQLALRYIRNYEYDEVNGVPQWIKNKRQKKDGELRSDGDRDLNND